MDQYGSFVTSFLFSFGILESAIAIMSIYGYNGGNCFWEVAL